MYSTYSTDVHDSGVYSTYALHILQQYQSPSFRKHGMASPPVQHQLLRLDHFRQKLLHLEIRIISKTGDKRHGKWTLIMGYHGEIIG